MKVNAGAPAGTQAGAPAADAHTGADIAEQDLQAQERAEDQLIMHLERDQFVAETSRAGPRAALSARTTAALWALRVLIVVVGVTAIVRLLAT